MAIRRIDLHVHSSFSSDGGVTPARLVEMAAALGLSAVALTDHDSVDGLDEFARSAGAVEMVPGAVETGRSAVETVPGVELTVDYDGGYLHILGYYVEHRSGMLVEMMNRLTAARLSQAAGRIARLRELGLVVEETTVAFYARGLPPVGPVIGMAVLKRPENRGHPLLAELYTGSKAESPFFHFDRDLFAKGKPADVPVKRPAPVEAALAIWGAGGVPVLAHPGEHFVLSEDRGKIVKLVEDGVAGLEVYSTYHNAGQERAFGALADDLGLVKTAGSDFHGSPVKPNVKMGAVSHNRYSILEELQERLQKGP